MFYKLPKGIDALVIPALTDLKESWYGIQIDKKIFHIEIDDENEDTCYLKIIFNKSYEERLTEFEKKVS